MSAVRLTRPADPHPKILELHRKRLAVIYILSRDFVLLDSKKRSLHKSLAQIYSAQISTTQIGTA
jgi:hypothetical protein